MSYQIHRADGTPITIPDNAIDTAFYTGVVPPGVGVGNLLIGRNTVDYGAAIAQNIVQMTENFASSSVIPDGISLQGQLWFNKTSTSTGDLYVKVKDNTLSGIANWSKLLTSDNSGNSNIPGNLSVGGAITSGTWNGSVIGSAYGGTGFSTYSTGDTLYASATNVLSKLPIGSPGQTLIVSVGGIPQWGSVISPNVTAVSITGATFNGGVSNGNAVRWNSGTGTWFAAVADGTTNDLAIGFANVTTNSVYLSGLITGLFTGLTPGAKYYLDTTTPGAITTVAPTNDAIVVGIAKNANDLFAEFTTLPYPIGTTGSSIPVLSSPNTYSAGQRGAISALGTVTGTVTLNLNNSNNFSATLGSNITLANPTNIVPGQSGCIYVSQDATGSRTIAFGGFWKSAGGIGTVSFSSTPNAVDRIAYFVVSSTQIDIVVGKNIS